MAAAIDALLVIVLLENLFTLGASRIRSIVYAVATQGVLLSLLPLLLHHTLGLREVLVSLGTLGLKGVTIPRMLMRAMADLPIRKEIEPLMGFKASLIFGAAATGGSIYVSTQLPLAGEVGTSGQMVIAASFATILTGFLLITTRIKALTQVLGYLVLENGIYIFGVLMLQATPFLVEVGLLLDLFVAIFVMGIIIHHISREFSSISTERLSTLKD
ncbi:MAG: hydrogenase [Planctomycetota bacterium]